MSGMRHMPMDEGPAEQGVRAILTYIGEDIDREGLRATPERVVRAFGEMTSGYGVDVGVLLRSQFEQHHSSLVLVRDVEFVSLCEHHMLPFTGLAHVGYIPAAGGKVVGISKLARVVDAFARRLQIQERLTDQVADAIEEHCKSVAVGVVISATHQCMACRGVRKPQSSTVTSAMRGEFLKDASARGEFLSLVGV